MPSLVQFLRFSLPVLGLFIYSPSEGKAAVSEANSQLQSAPEYEAIVRGQDAEVCAWPTTVLVMGPDGVECSGTLIHPQVVTYAAHCGAEDKSVYFGEHEDSAIEVVPEFCTTNPEYRDQSNDWALCKLEAPIDLPITPPIWGHCERGEIHNGKDVVIAGFGEDRTGGDGSHAGQKRWAFSKINRVDYGNNVVDIGGYGNPSVYKGDSGGSAFVRFEDGSWHAFGIAATVRVPEPYNEARYSLLSGAVPWIESTTGFDVTPCFDEEGEWSPSFDCGKFYAAEAGMGHGEFKKQAWCEDTLKIGWSDSCGESWVEQDGAAPLVRITSPEDGTSFENDGAITLTIEVEASDDLAVKEVALAVNDRRLDFLDSEPPYRFEELKIEFGEARFVAFARDWADNESASDEVIVVLRPSETDSETGSESESEPKPSPNPGDDSGKADSDSSDGGNDQESTSGGDNGGETAEESNEDGLESAGESSESESGETGWAEVSGGGSGCTCNGTGTPLNRGFGSFLIFAGLLVLGRFRLSR